MSGTERSLLGQSRTTWEIVPPVFRGSIAQAFAPRSCFAQPHFLRYRVIEVTSFPDSARYVRPFEKPRGSFWSLRAAQARAQQLKEEDTDEAA